MRSSIACVRCRRSKVKCVNTGPNTTCRACEASNRECTYPPPVVSGAPRVSSGTAAVRTSNSGSGRDIAPGGGGGAAAPHHGTPGDRAEAPKKPKPKKPAPAGNVAPGPASYQGAKAFKDALDAPILTPAMWTQVFEAFQLHHSPTLPFLHPPSFLSRLRVATAGSAATNGGGSTPPAPEKPHSPLVLLGLLTLAARHVPTLVAYHAPALTTPSAVSDFYASALKYRLHNDDDTSLNAPGEKRSAFATPTLEKTQAILMLAVHEWGMCRGSEAYVWLGIAIRMGGVLGLSWDDVHEDEQMWANPFITLSLAGGKNRREASPSAKRRKLDNYARPSSGGSGTGSINNNNHDSKASGKDFIEKEVRRRTFWALFMLDRSLSSGRFRPSGISLAEASRVQLPCEERGFLFGEGVRTGFLSVDGYDKTEERNGGDSKRWEVGEDEGILARVVRITEIWGRVQDWACAGGRRQEKYPPWSPHSKFYRLSQLLDGFHSSLPRHLHFSPQTLSAHMSSRTSSAYAVMHITYFLCLVIMHREYIPFLPLRINRPQGPLDPPIFLADDPETDREGLEPGTTVSDWWEESAKEIFRCARGIMQIVNGLEEWSSSVETPAVGFAVYMVGVSGVYAWSFPWMDQSGYITGSIPHEASASGDDEDEDMEGSRSSRSAEGTGLEARKAVELITKMKGMWRMAEGWFLTLGRMRKYFQNVRSEYVRLHGDGANSDDGAPEKPEAAVARRLKDGLGGGYEEYKRFEQLFHDFTGISDSENATARDSFNTPPPHAPQKRSAPETANHDPEIKREGSTGTVTKREGDVEALLLAAEGANSAPGGDRWMAVNTPRQQQEQQAAAAAAAAGTTAPRPQQPTSSPHRRPEQGPAQPGAQSEGYLTSLASYAADQQPMPAPAPAPAQTPKEGTERKRMMEHEQLQRELDKGERCGGGAEDLAVFVNGRGIEDWDEGSWMGRIWEK
ncbi:uncharacterized protein H6S33_004843 [Morchella sextelata]|uniref:uncharacterized protein n=1 Tax=Morchella sextelata TaxID=1174677 RepID=UPI001D041528|nr:uncharacterized protein H6S33_004843 [Morchella sextelata]KAH0605621.1 hypothetical protein H6S33_004843 [Morchella sextelata]